MREMTNRDFLEMAAVVAQADARDRAIFIRPPRASIEYVPSYERRRRERLAEEARLAKIAKQKPERAKNRARRKARRTGR